MALFAEFARAARRADTYDPRRNTYLWFGLLWGLPIPLVGLWIDCRSRGLPFDLVHVREALEARPFHALLLLHPLLFAALFAVLGAMRARKEAQAEALLRGLERGLDGSKAARLRLEQLMEHRDREVAIAAHELKSPLAAIKGYSQLLLSEELGTLDARQREALSASSRSTDLLHRRIEDMLVATALEGNELPIELTSVDVLAALDTAAHTLASVAAHRKIAVVRSAPPGLFVVADPVRLDHVLVNLLANALRFAPPGGRVELAATSREERGPVRIAVTDDGCGIAAADIPSLGQRYRQASGPAHRSGGTGLGLFIVKGILEAHGSALEVQSEPGRGTTMSFQLRGVTPAPACPRS